MDDIPLEALLGVLFVLFLLSGFFAMAETSLMAVNRYRLRVMAKGGHKGAVLAEWLLLRTDKFLGVVLLGNNLVNAAAASLVTVITFRYFGEDQLALTIGTLSVTFLILVFSEVTPKVIGAAYADHLAPWVSFILVPLLRVVYPAVWIVNVFVNGLLRLLRLTPTSSTQNSLGVEELRSLLTESGSFLPSQHRSILMNLFDLEKGKVEDVMIPRSQIEAIDLETEAADIVRQLSTSHHSRLPVYAGEPNNILGIVQVRRALARMAEEDFDLDKFKGWLREAYFIPAGTTLFTQLTQFQATRQSLGLVVDEYGELLGLVSVEDLLEEIVGEFTAVRPGEQGSVMREPDGSVLVEGSAALRTLNRRLCLDLPLDGPRTLNGLIIERLEAMPEQGVSVLIEDYPVEIVQVHERMVKTARIGPRRKSH